MSVLPLAATLVTPVLLLAATALARSRGYRVPYRVLAPLSLVAGVVVGVALGVFESERGLRLVVVFGLATAFGLVHAIDAPGGRWAARLRSRFLLGVPWGTFLSVSLVVAVYLFLQGGLEHPYNPLTIPFTSWSYFYPLGLVTAPFSHANFGHVTGNLIGTLVLAPVAEYAWSHFPTGRGRSSFSSWRTNPYVRAFVLFPLGVVLVGLGTSAFAWGAIIGFSGVVFAFAGFAVVRYPVLTVVALSARGAVTTVYYALRNPIVTGSASPSYGPPWWVGVAIQGHLLGLLLGAVLGVVIVGKRERLPSAGRVFAGALLLGFSFTLYAVWWYRDPTTFVLYRGLGVLLVVVLAVVLAAALSAGTGEVVDGVSHRQVAIAVALVPLLTMAMVAVPLNTTTVDAFDPPADAIDVGGYQVYYAEDVENKRVGAIDVEALNETTRVSASGVIVVSESRNVWTEAVSKGALDFWGEREVRVGGVGWSETIKAKREGWQVAGGGPVYHVYLAYPEDRYRHVFASRNDTASPTIENRNVTVVPANGTFYFAVSNNTTVIGNTTIPSPGNVTTAGGITFRRDGPRVYATRNGTRVLVATRESYS